MKCDEVAANMMKQPIFQPTLLPTKDKTRCVFCVTNFHWSWYWTLYDLEVTPQPFWFITVHYNTTDTQTCQTTTTHTCSSDVMYSNRSGKNMQLCVSLTVGGNEQLEWSVWNLVHNHVHTHIVYELYTFNCRQLFLLYCLIITVLSYTLVFISIFYSKETIKYYHIFFFDTAHKKIHPL
jgi:hypothetical protein